jgi:hypothetical protein
MRERIYLLIAWSFFAYCAYWVAWGIWRVYSV